MSVGYDESFTGYEDFNDDWMPVPRIYMDHHEQVFKESGSDIVIGPTLYCVILSVAKQRTFWGENSDGRTGRKPRCKSNDSTFGLPNTTPANPADEGFIWEGSNFNPADQVYDDSGNTLLPCKSCHWADWSDGPEGKRVPPPCNEVFAFSLQYWRPDATLEQGGEYLLGVIQFSKTAIPACKAYINSFRTSKRSLFAVNTIITLDPHKEGVSRRWVTPIFTPGEPRDIDYWAGDSEQGKMMMEFLKQAPRGVDVAQIEEKRRLQLTAGPVVSAPVVTLPTPVVRPAGPPPAAPATPVFPTVVEPPTADDPWASPAGSITADPWPTEAPASAPASPPTPVPPPPAPRPAPAPPTPPVTAQPAVTVANSAAPFPPPPSRPAPPPGAVRPAPAAQPGPALSDIVIDATNSTLPF